MSNIKEEVKEEDSLSYCHEEGDNLDKKLSKLGIYDPFE
jgi:hypothetical protein